MVVKIYVGLWAALVAAVIGAAMTGNLNGIFGVAAGMTAFGLVFLGMIAVLPLTLAPKPHAEHIATERFEPAFSKVGKDLNPKAAYKEITAGFHGNALPRSL